MSKLPRWLSIERLFSNFPKSWASLDMAFSNDTFKGCREWRFSLWRHEVVAACSTYLVQPIERYCMHLHCPANGVFGRHAKILIYWAHTISGVKSYHRSKQKYAVSSGSSLWQSCGSRQEREVFKLSKLALVVIIVSFLGSSYLV